MPVIKAAHTRLQSVERRAILYAYKRTRHMRKIERQMCDAIRDNKSWRSGNTEVQNNPYGSLVYLHGNHIATVTDDAVQLFDGGWQTNTTKSRLNAICNAFCIDGEGIFQEKFEWFIHKFVGQHGETKVYNKEEFVNGYVFG
jgi:hypothetical protein